MTPRPSLNQKKNAAPVPESNAEPETVVTTFDHIRRDGALVKVTCTLTGYRPPETKENPS